MIITIKDETFSGNVLYEQQLEFTTQKVSVQEIITQRVEKEVARYNAKPKLDFQGLVVPTFMEEKVNQYQTKKRPKIDVEKQVYVALDAFQKNGYFLLVNDIQLERLDQEVILNEDSKISFIKLTPLVGG